MVSWAPDGLEPIGGSTAAPAPAQSHKSKLALSCRRSHKYLNLNSGSNYRSQQPAVLSRKLMIRYGLKGTKNVRML